MVNELFQRNALQANRSFPVERWCGRNRLERALVQLAMTA